MLTALIRYKLPIFILENGICTDDDAQRWEFIRGHLSMVHKAIENGAKVIGYTYWSLLDNFEWDKGFVPRFGLIEVDYRTQARTVRESAKKLAQACLTNSLE
ncbi:MAG: family 1 glycosylhydrolase [Candidatus Omnitrophica bacterium]|nr:family 1 glycosylhydrolase [Candidatus Omnitrophota bacterium]